MNALGEDAFELVLARLRTALGAARGKLRASDALVIAGFDGPSYHRTQLVARALRELGWERGRYRFHGSLLYAYARGTQLEREAMLIVELDEAAWIARARPEEPVIDLATTTTRTMKQPPMPMTKRTPTSSKKPNKKPAKKPARKLMPPAIAMHSAASPEWGTPMLLRRFGAHVLAPAAMGRAIDLDYASSSYWNQWWDEADRPHVFLDGSKGRDVLVEADRRSAAPRLGSGFMNAPGIGGGDMVQQCWGLFEQDHREEKLGSGFWVGFSVEQFGSLQNVGERNPLTVDEDDLITTIVPSRRAHYVVRPEQLIAIIQRKMKKRARGDKQRRKEQELIEKIRNRTDERPMDGGAPSHLSYLSILWHRERTLRRTQMEATRAFLKEQQENPKSLLYKFEVIGPLELKARP